MKIGNFNFKRRYTAAQIVVDIISLLSLLYIFYIVYVCAADIEQAKQLNATEVSLDFLKWEPLIIWCVLGLGIYILSVVIILLPRKMPKKITLTEKYVSKYCNIIDTCVSCVRLMLLLAVSEFCYIHMCSLTMREASLSIQLVLHAIIIALIIWFTAVRVNSISEMSSAELEKKPRTIIEN